MPWAHVDYSIGLLAAEGGECFGEVVCADVGEKEGDERKLVVESVEFPPA